MEYIERLLLIQGLSIVMLRIDYEYKCNNQKFQIQNQLKECPILLEISKNPVLCVRVQFQFLKYSWKDFKRCCLIWLG